jgi:hypothetical protein
MCWLIVFDRFVVIMCLGCTDCIEERRPKRVYCVNLLLINNILKLFNNKILKNGICSSLYISNSKETLFVFPRDTIAASYWSTPTNITISHLAETIEYNDRGYYEQSIVTSAVQIKRFGFKN